LSDLPECGVAYLFVHVPYTFWKVPKGVTKCREHAEKDELLYTLEGLTKGLTKACEYGPEYFHDFCISSTSA